MLLYGYGHLRQCSPVLLEGVAAACSSRLHEFSSQDLCVTLWSYGMVQYSPAGEMRLQEAAITELLWCKT